VFNFIGYKRDLNLKKNSRFHLTPVRMAIFKDNNSKKGW
jgi:hypothetical protein